LLCLKYFGRREFTSSAESFRTILSPSSDQYNIGEFSGFYANIFNTSRISRRILINDGHFAELFLLFIIYDFSAYAMLYISHISNSTNIYYLLYIVASFHEFSSMKSY
jgi:hypothetical protein